MSEHSTPVVTLPHAAHMLCESGLSVIPIASVADKNPSLESWKPYTIHAPQPAEAAHWFTANGTPAAPALAIVCGAVSGGLTVIDFDLMRDGRTLYPEWTRLVEKLAPGLLATLPVVETPSGGHHVYLRCPVVESNQKLAESAARQTWIETRGEGGYVLAPPSEGYVKRNGSLTAIPEVGVAQYELLLHAAKSLTAKPLPREKSLDDGDVLPGDAYNAAASLFTVVDLLIKHGWQRVHSATTGVALRRPGKDRGVSATVRESNGMPVFYCFSTNAPAVPAMRGVSPFGLYAALEHGGDYSAAARALGTPVPINRSVAVVPTQPAQGPESFDWRALIHPIDELRRKEFAPVQFIVDGVIPNGVTLIAGAPKAGKSLLGWGIACAVATGGVALGNIPVQQRRVLYLMLEDGQRLVQKRVRRMVAEETEMPMLDYAEAWRPLTDGGVDDLAAYHREYPDALVVIDTYEHLRGRSDRAQDAYRNDTAALAPLTRMAHETGLNVLIIHHTNKRGGDDPFMSINGSNGIGGAVDTMGVLSRVRFGEDVTLCISGRDLDEDVKLALAFDMDCGSHVLLGKADEVGATRLQRDIVLYLKAEGGPRELSDIAEAVGRDNDGKFRTLMSRLVDAGTLKFASHGRYCLPGQGLHAANVTFGGSNPMPDDNGPEDEPPIEPSQAAPTECNNGTINGVPAVLQAKRCAGCGKAHTKAPAPAGDGTFWCKHCGVTAPME